MDRDSLEESDFTIDLEALEKRREQRSIKRAKKIFGCFGLFVVLSLGTLYHIALVQRHYVVEYEDPGIRCYKAGQYDQSIQYLLKFIHAAGGERYAFYYLGLCYSKKNQPLIARREFETAIRVSQGSRYENPTLEARCQAEIDKIDHAQSP